MSKLNDILNPYVHVTEHNPVTAFKTGKSVRGKNSDGIKSLLDPQGDVFVSQGIRVKDAENKRLFESGLGKKKKKKRIGMKAGGSTSKCGVGGYYRKR